ncbi:MAG: hypothetical protein AAGJ10_01950 [Bacteroidota bacterium]
MSRLATLSALLLFVSACSATKNAVPAAPPAPEAPAAAPAPAVSEAPAAIGVWDYTISGTPQGDAGGVLTLAWSGDAYTGEMTNDMLFQTVDVDDFALDGNQVKFSATFDMQGQALVTKVTAKLTGNTMLGEVQVPGFGAFDFDAERRTP